MNKDNTEEILTLTTSNEELEKKLFEETDLNNIKNIINLFNLNIKKKDIVRTAKLNELQDKVYDQIDKRITLKPDEFSNSDLLSYFKTIQESINKADTSLDKVDTPSIQIIQNQLNIKDDGTNISRDSRLRIVELVNKFMNMNSNEDVVDIKSTDVSDDDYYEQLTLNFDEDQ